MRIIGGKYRGLVLHPPKGLPVRPTTDQAKEGLFNILSHRFDTQGAHVLELFAGTGHVSYEFASRGAAHLTAVDQHPGCVRYIQSMFSSLGAQDQGRAKDWQGQAVCLAAEKFVAQAGPAYQFIFMDPPYAWEGVPDLVAAIFAQGRLAQEGLLVVEHASGANYSHLRYFSEIRKYGSSSFSFFQWE
jgi:16S rRNA (guanine966-N2)-methyltransferase